MRNFTKSFLLLLAALFSFSMAFAETGTETEANQKNGNKNTTAEGQSYTIDGTYIAGTGSSSAAPMTSKGLKFRTAQNGGTLEFTVRENYTITKLYMAAIGNYQAVDNSLPYIKVSKVEVDGTEVEFDGGEFPEKGASEAGELTVDNIEAKEKIVLYFDNSNTNSGETQLNASWSIDWSRPDATQPTITVTPKSLALVPGASSKLSVHVDPASFTTLWVSSDETVATVSEDGLVTAVAAGTAIISHQWADDATVADAAVINVAEFDPSAYMVTTYDFTAMGDISLTLSEEAAGAIWNEGNNKTNNVFFCTNEGLENIAVQAALNGGKGWSIIDGEGLVLASGAGRCAAVGNLKAGQIVEIIYTGNNFYTGSKNDAVRKDDGALKTALNEGIGRAIYLMDEDGLLGFELERGKAVTQINIYSINPIDAAKETLQKVVNVAKMLGVDTADAEALLASEEATVEQLTAALQTLFGALQQKAADVVTMLKAFFNQFDTAAAAALEPYFAAAEEALAGTDFDAMRETTTALAVQCLEVGKSAMGKVDSYLRKMENETLNTDLDNIKAAIAGISNPNEILGLIPFIQQLKDDMIAAVTTYLAGVYTLISEGTAAGKDVSAVQTAFNNVMTVAISYNAGTATLVEMGVALYQLIKAVEAYKEAIEPVIPVFPDNAIVYDFEAAAAAGENPANKNGSAANGQAFYGWENAEKTDSKRQDYKGYEWAEGSVLPEVCHVWRRSDRINGNVAEGGLKCPSNKEMAIDGLNVGDKVIIVYDATAAAEDSKELLWAIGDGTSDGGPGVVRASATIDGVEAVTGESTIASGAEIVVNSVTPADNGTGYIVFQAKKGMIIKQVAVIPAEEPVGINAVYAADNNNVIYNLSGQKVMKAQKGLYIINGKKVFVK